MSEPTDPTSETPEERRRRLLENVREEESEADALKRLIEEMSRGKRKQITPGGASTQIH